ncbi:hypothetical protein D210916BOD24_05900 [Alteromonas sp. D210916BOD_24]|uniref:beta-propeller domain-containing protein n=1 Tax=Alteromonas sp. D210916BOD_24 TaxID=3157618 RepID=UPI00399C8682
MMNRPIEPDTLWQGLAIIIFSTCVITACSQDSDDDLILVTSPPTLSYTTTSSSPLGHSSDISASHYVKNGLYLMYTSEPPVPSEAPVGPEMSDSDNFSSTNTQVEGVDEADRMEYNGQFIFAADVPVWNEDTGQTVNQVRVMERQSDYSLAQVSSIPLTSDVEVAGLYLYNDVLGVVSHSYQYYLMYDIFSLTSPWQQSDNYTFVDVVNVASPTAPDTDARIQIDGGLISSRRIDNELYLAMQYVPHVQSLPAVDGTDVSLVNLYNVLSKTDNELLTPSITINGQTSSLFELDNCLIPENATSQNGHVQMVSMVKIDLNTPTNYIALCMLVQADGLYMSNDNVYLHASEGSDTIIHKVALSDGIAYQASGRVPGELGWRSNPQFKMSEQDGHFVVITSQFTGVDGPTHVMHVLAQQGRTLAQAATLPNENESAPIGKPGEDIYAVRFFADKAYVVTFERIDPLYVIDLSDVLAPHIEGELNIPGFSSYLHPMENGLLLGVGQQVSVENLPETGTQPQVTPVVEGMKVSLFDVLDPANPIVLDELVWSDAYTPVEYEHRALSVLKTEGGYRFAIPSETWSTDEENWYLSYSLNLLQVDSAQRSLSLINGMKPTLDQAMYFTSYSDRSILHGDHVYYLRGNAIFHALWQEGALVNGPY